MGVQITSTVQLLISSMINECPFIKNISLISIVFGQKISVVKVQKCCKYTRLTLEWTFLEECYSLKRVE